MYKSTHTFIFTAFFVLGLFSFAATTEAQPPPPKFFNERFVMKAMEKLHGAQATYRITAGNGNFGTLHSLGELGFIDGALASGLKYSYRFVVNTTPVSGNTPASFTATATPLIYRKGGLRSYFIDQTGELRGGDKNGDLATASDPYIDSCALWGLNDNERCTIMDMRALHGAQSTYAATFGNGNYGIFQQLYDARLIRSDLADYHSRGYLYLVSTLNAGPSQPPRFTIWATPHFYGTTGRRSFYIDQTGVIRGADHNGGQANENDPPVN